MLKKNLIGIIVVLLIFAGFYAGYTLGKGSGSSQSGTGPGMPGGGPPSSSSSPASQEGGMPQVPNRQNNPSGDAQWVKPVQGGSAADSDSAVVNVAWAEPLDMNQEGEQGIERGPQGQQLQQTMDDTISVPQDKQTVPAEEHQIQPDALEDIPASGQTDPSIQTFYGTVVPYAEANVQSEQGGTITVLNGKEGDLVKKGDVLVRFDDRDMQLELQQALASKNSAVQQVNQAESNFQTIQANVKRYQELFEDGFVSKQEVDDLQNQLTSAMTSLNSAKESVRQNEVQVQMIENTLTDFQVRAPIGGLIDAKEYNLSEVYQGSGVIYHLIDIERVYVDVEIPETYLKEVREGMAVSVVFDAVGEQPFSGILETILPSGTSDNRSFTAKVLVQNPDLTIKPGMFARIEMSADGSAI